MIMPQPADSDFDDDDDDAGSDPFHSESSIADIQFWIDHPLLDDLTAAQSEPDRQQVRRDVEDCIRLLSLPMNRLDLAGGTTATDLKKLRLPAGRYKVIQLLGVGAFGVVLHTRDRVLNRDVAVKILRPSVLLSKRARERFASEGEALARCNCEGVVPIHEVGQIEGNPYLVMGLIQGSTLAEYIKAQERPVDVDLAARIVAAISDSVHRAHRRGILHRDLKPSNVLLEQHSELRFGLPFKLFVSDFGLAKDMLPNSSDFSNDGSTDSPIIGTVRYMSPEQATGLNSDVSVTSDVFSLGVILYELLTLQCPFNGPTTFEIIRQVAGSHAKPPRQLNARVTRDLDAIVGRCLSKSPSDRYQSAGELSEDLHRFLEHKPVLAKPVGPIKATLFWAKRNPSLALASAVIWIGLVVSTIAISLLYRENLKNLKATKDAELLAETSRKFTLKAIDSSFRFTAEKLLQNVPQSNALKLELQKRALKINQEYAEQRGFDEESRYRLSIAHHLVANDAEKCQQFELAARHRKLCLVIVGALVEQNPQNVNYQFDVFMNRLLTRRQQEPDSERLEWLLKTREYLLSAIALAPNNPDYEDADAAICYEIAFVDASNSGKWLDYAIQKSLKLGEKHPDRPHYFKYAINGHHALANNAIKKTEWAAACTHCQAALTIIETHFRKSKDMADIQSAYIASFDLHATAIENFDVLKALEVYDRYAAAMAELETMEPRFEFYRIRRASAHLRQAKLHRRLGDLSTCKLTFAKASAILEDYHPALESDAGELALLRDSISEFQKLLTTESPQSIPDGLSEDRAGTMER